MIQAPSSMSRFSEQDKQKEKRNKSMYPNVDLQRSPSFSQYQQPLEGCSSFLDRPRLQILLSHLFQCHLELLHVQTVYIKVSSTLRLQSWGRNKLARTFPFEGSVKIDSMRVAANSATFSKVFSESMDTLYSFFCFPALAANLIWGSMYLTACEYHAQT